MHHSNRLLKLTSRAVLGAACFTGLALSTTSARAQVAVHSNSTSWTSATKSVSVTCPAGEVPLSAGFQVGGTMNQGRINVTEVYPSGSSVSVRAEEALVGFSSNWSLSAYAVCAPAPAGYQVVSGTINSASASSVGRTVSCPGSKVLLGAGVQINQPANQVLLTALDVDATSVYVEAQEDVAGTTSLWSITGYAVCADPLSTHGVYESWTSQTTADSKMRGSGCPSGTEILGVGGWIENPTNNGDVSFSRLYPIIYNGSHSASSSAAEAMGTMSANNTWGLHTQVICGVL